MIVPQSDASLPAMFGGKERLVTDCIMYNDQRRMKLNSRSSRTPKHRDNLGKGAERLIDKIPNR